MWRWPWRTERRAASSDPVTLELLRRGYSQAVAGGLAAAEEIAAGFYQRALFGASIDPSGLPIGPEILGAIGRELILRGEAVYWVAGSGRDLQLVPVSGCTVYPARGEDQWLYELTIASPHTTRVIRAAGSSVVHVRYSYDPAQPWRGVGPFQRAELLREVSAKVETRLREEFSKPVGLLMPVPAGGEAFSSRGAGDPGKSGSHLDRSLPDPSALAGGVLYQQVPRAARITGPWSPDVSWDSGVKHLSPNPTPPAVALRGEVEQSLLAAAGVPGVLRQKSEGVGLREGWRVFVVSSVAPVAALIAEELSRKLGLPIKIGFADLRHADLQARTSAVGNLVEAGMELEEALRRIEV